MGRADYFAVFTSAQKESEKEAALERFVEDPVCTVMLMDFSGIVGLDLSFVTLVIAMEPLLDVAMQASG